jgi:hypothetical protein
MVRLMAHQMVFRIAFVMVSAVVRHTIVGIPLLMVVVMVSAMVRVMASVMVAIMA